MSSSEFHPVWPRKEGVQLTDLDLREMESVEGRTTNAGGLLPLRELGRMPAQRCAPDVVTAAGPDVIQRAYERGFAEGREQGIAEGYERIVPTIEVLSGLTQTLEQTHADFSLDLERSLHALAIAVAKHIIQRELSLDPTIVTGLVQQALDLVPRDVTLEVRLNPDDLERLQDQLHQVEAGGRPLHIQWLGDSALEPGGFLVETPLRVVDGRIDEALRALYERLGDE